MIRTELCEMIALAQRLLAVNEPAALATLFASRGSTYRSLGSMMVSGPGSMIAGGVSGGCLEQYVARHGRSLTHQQAAAMLSFDADADGEDNGKPVLGCGGSIEILVERFTPDHLAFLRQLKTATEADTSSAAACVIDSSASQTISVRRFWLEEPRHSAGDPQLQRLGQRSQADRKSRHGLLGPQRQGLIHYIRPLTRMVIFGAGDDVRPLCSLGRSLGWHVTIADRRGRLATRSRFPDADQVVTAEWGAAVDEIVFTPQTAAVLMTHSLSDDTEILPLLSDKALAYVGALGPEHRRRWLLDGVEKTTALDPAWAARVRGPIGLNLGDRSAAGIAVSIASEILADMNGRSAVPLSPSTRQAPARTRGKALVAHG